MALAGLFSRFFIGTIQSRDIVARRAVVGMEAHGGPKMKAGLRPAPGQHEGFTELVVRLGIVGLELQQRLDIPDGVGQPAGLLAQGDGQIETGVSHVGFQSHRRFIVDHGLGLPPGYFHEHHAQTVVRPRIIGLGPQRSFIMGDGLAEPPGNIR
jgi:hypothetical protein